MSSKSFLLFLVAAILFSASTGKAQMTDDQTIERGKYLVIIGGCNDCHTTGYLASEGQTPEDLWLAGDSFGWRGPWGTTYGPNLRITVRDLSEDQWVTLAKNLTARPPMPWFALNEWRDEDLRAVYQYIRQLKPVGEPAPAFVPPEEEPNPPYAVFPSPPPE